MSAKTVNLSITQIVVGVSTAIILSIGAASIGAHATILLLQSDVAYIKDGFKGFKISLQRVNSNENQVARHEERLSAHSVRISNLERTQAMLIQQAAKTPPVHR